MIRSSATEGLTSTSTGEPQPIAVPRSPAIGIDPGMPTGGTQAGDSRLTGADTPGIVRDGSLKILNMDSPDIPELAELDILTDHEQLRLRDYLRTRIEDVPYKHWVSTIAQYPQIECNLLVHDGRPVIAGTKIAVSTIIGYLTLGAGIEALQRNYPDLTQESIKQAVDFALSMLEG